MKTALLAVALASLCRISSSYADGYGFAADPGLVVVDRGGDPVAGATVTWSEAAFWPCDMTAAVRHGYAGLGTGTTDAAGRVANFPTDTRELVARVLTKDGRGAFGKIDSATNSLVVEKLASLSVAASCDGDCGAIDASGTIATNGASCTVTASQRNGRFTIAHAIPGALELKLHAGGSGPNESVATVRQQLTGDTTATPRLARIGGALSLRGKLTVDHDVPASISSVHIACGPELARDASVDPRTGEFVFGNLPGRACVLTASSARGAQFLQRDLRVQPGAFVAVELD
jgi:hypothetical protein